MKKIKMTADRVLSIVRGIFNDEDIDTKIDDPSAPSAWQDKTIQEILNIKYLAFKHRPVSTEKIIAEEIKNGAQEVDKLAALNRGFCSVWIDDIERLFSKDVDMITLSASMEYWVQTSKIQLLEYLIEDCNIATSGLRIPVQFGDEIRKAVIIFSQPNVTDIQTGTMCGEMAVIEVTASIILYPDTVSYSDYKISITRYDNDRVITSQIPTSSLSVASAAVQKSTPRMNRPQDTSNINLSKAISFVFVFDGYTSDFIEYLTDKNLKGDESEDEDENNEAFTLTIERATKSYRHTVIVKDHQIVVPTDMSNEVHTLTLVKGGL